MVNSSDWVSVPACRLQSKSPGAESADWKGNSLTVVVMLAQLGLHMWTLMETGERRQHH